MKKSLFICLLLILSLFLNNDNTFSMQSKNIDEEIQLNKNDLPDLSNPNYQINNLPDSFLGFWNVFGTLQTTNDISKFNNNSSDIWVIEKKNNNVFLTNPINKTSQQLKIISVKGNNIIYKNATQDEQVNITLKDDTFSGIVSIKVSPNSVATYKITGKKSQNNTTNNKNSANAVISDNNTDNSKIAEAYYENSLTKIQNKDYKGALNDINKAIELDNQQPIGYYQRGKIKQLLKDHKGALKDFNKAQQLNYPLGVGHDMMLSQNYLHSLDEFKNSGKPNFTAYMIDLQIRIKSHWYPPKGADSKSVTALFTIAKDGKLLKYSLLNSSGVKEVDDAAIKAIEKTIPFEPLPSEFKDDKVDVQFTFDYNAIKNIEKSNKPLNKIEDIDFGPYMADLQRKIEANWKPPRDNNSKQIIVLFTIARNGDLLNYKIIQSSGIPDADKAAQEAIEKSKPFTPLPTQYTKPSVDIQFTFDYNTIKNIEKSNKPLNKIEDIDFRPYMADLQRRIKSNWKPPRDNNSKQIIVLFTIARNGDLLTYEIIQSSGIPDADKAARDAIEKSKPFAPLPTQYASPSIDIQFTFDYNVFGNNLNRN